MSIGNIFRNYDIRGEYGVDLSEDIGEKIAKAYAVFAKPKQVALGYDNRLSSLELKKGIVKGLISMGVNVIDIGMVSTDVLYFATWKYDLDGGLMITASHMPKEYNGVKFLRLDGQRVLSPIGRGIGMEELEKIYIQQKWEDANQSGKITNKNVLPDFVDFVHSFVDMSTIKPLKVVMDAGNGMGGIVAEKVFDNLGLKITKLFFEPDGSFPNHTPNPFLEENRREWVKTVKSEKADLGIAWDADCDRVYFLDEKGNFVPGDFITTLLAISFLEKEPGSGIVYDVRASKAVPDWIAKKNGQAHIERVGHTYIKKKMRDTNSLFGGEVSGHYYFSSNAYMDNGFIPAMIILEMLSKTRKPFSKIIQELGDYHVSGEINYTVKDAVQTLKNAEKHFANAVEISKMDGISFEFEDWRFNLRPSANDPVIRLNLEAKTAKQVEERVKEVEEMIKE